MYPQWRDTLEKSTAVVMGVRRQLKANTAITASAAITVSSRTKRNADPGSTLLSCGAKPRGEQNGSGSQAGATSSQSMCAVIIRTIRQRPPGLCLGDGSRFGLLHRPCGKPVQKLCTKPPGPPQNFIYT